MTDLEYTIRAICKRRGVTLSKIESVLFNVRITSALAVGSNLLPAGANTFYFVKALNPSKGTAMTGVPVLRYLPQAAVGSVGNMDAEINITNNQNNLLEFECDSLTYEGGLTAGYCCISGIVFKITTA